MAAATVEFAATSEPAVSSRIVVVATATAVAIMRMFTASLLIFVGTCAI